MAQIKHAKKENILHISTWAMHEWRYLETKLNEVEQYCKSYLHGPQMTALVVALCAKINVWGSLMFAIDNLQSFVALILNAAHVIV